jgi:uncharacterized membrane protein
MTAIVSLNGVTGPQKVVLEQDHHCALIERDLARRSEREAERRVRIWTGLFFGVFAVAVMLSTTLAGRAGWLVAMVARKP